MKVLNFIQYYINHTDQLAWHIVRLYKPFLFMIVNGKAHYFVVTIIYTLQNVQHQQQTSVVHINKYHMHVPRNIGEELNLSVEA